MSSSHKDRMKAIGSVAIPPKGTHGRELLEKFLKESETPKNKKLLAKLWENARAILTAQQLNGAGKDADQALRWFQQEYNSRIWNFDLHSLPGSFNVVEAFLEYNPRLNTFILHEENNNLFSFPEFVDWYTSVDTELDQNKALEAFTPGTIYYFDNMSDPGDLLYGIERKSEIGIAGFAMVRFGSEISVLCVAGETENLIKKTEELIDSFQDQNIKHVEGKTEIQPDPSLSIEAVPLKSNLPLWRLIALTRFDISEMTQSVRYVCHDAGNAFKVITDDPCIFLNIKRDFTKNDIEEMLCNTSKAVKEYNALFDLCSTSIFLPLYFEKFAEKISVERIKTSYANEVNKISFSKVKDNIPPKLKITYRNVHVLRIGGAIYDNRSTIYSIPNFHIEASGYWRTLMPGKMGADKNGNPIHGRTWVSKKLTWMEADEPIALIAKRDETKTLPEGPNPGFIYVMRSPLHPKNIFKIGLTRKTTEERANELSSASGVPGKIYVMHEWAVGDCISLEKEIHCRLAEYRIDPRREFFEASFDHITAIINETINSIKKHI